MGLGFNDGFKPVSDEPLIHLPVVFWDIPAMREEALAVKESAYCWKTEDYTVSGCPVGDNTPQLSQTYYDFIELYGDCGEVSVSYLYIDKDSDYMWHTDNEISKRTGHTEKDVKCAVNIIVLGEESCVEFDEWGEYGYTAALFNTSHLHRIKPTSDRIICKISFRDLYFTDVINKIF